ncbi:MAG: tRNA pseudouridine(38-40) synthase TruA [Pseudomonadaceae bacterium]|nr:tRNA pseudouridine(38-40) synthase TruA [Pseudomonadaceae bacterium]
MTRLKLTLAYNGHGLYGWQRQQAKGNHTGHDLPTVEGLLLDAWKKLTGEALGNDAFQAAGRTDAGVHALGMVVHVETGWPHAATPIKVMDGLNHYLPDSIRAVRAAVVDENFHARFSGVARHYRYVLYTRRVMRPDWVGRAGHERRALDVARMAEALEYLPLGPHDFSAFRDAECQSHDPVCHLLHRRVDDMGEGFVHIHISANRFLQHMVRNMVGTLVECGLREERGRVPRPVDDMARVLATRDRTRAGITFAAEGLYFLGVDYPPHTELAIAGEGGDVDVSGPCQEG